MERDWSNLTQEELDSFLNAAPQIADAQRWPTTDELVAGFNLIRSRMTQQETEMLVNHYHAEGRSMTMHELAMSMGFESYRTANLRYGNLAKKLYTEIGYPPPQSQNTTGTFWILGLGEFIDRRSEGLDMLCVMRPEVARALEIVGMVTPNNRSATFDDESELDQDEIVERLLSISSRNMAENNSQSTSDESDGSGGHPLTLANCDAFDIVDELSWELDLLDNPMGVAWKCRLHPEAYEKLKSSVQEFGGEPYIYEENGQEYLRVFDNNNIPFVIHMRIAGIDDQLSTELYGDSWLENREIDTDFPIPTAQRRALAAHGLTEESPHPPSGKRCEASDTRYIQSCVTSIGFPEFPEDLEFMFEKNEGYAPGRQLTDLEIILNFDQLGADFAEWTAARWMTEGDVLFFYHTNRGHKKIKRLLKDFQTLDLTHRTHYRNTIETLERNLEMSKGVESCIFACAQVQGSAMYYAKEENEHFKSRNFVPFNSVHIFENPLHTKDFGEHFKIGQNTVTPIYARNFGAIRDLLAQRNELPDFLRYANVGELNFQNIGPENWRAIVASSQTRFLNEELVREYFIDYLLKEIRDPRTPILEECVTWRNGESTGRADYFVMIAGRWIPVEAKLNILTERDLLGQVGKYIRVDKFVPTIRQRRNTEFFPDRHATCIVIDQSGVYLTHDQQFVDCDFERPWLSREGVTRDFVADLRRAVSDFR